LPCVVCYALAKGPVILIGAFVITWSARRLGIEDWLYEIKHESKNCVQRGN
jgi:hypothetical protein